MRASGTTPGVEPGFLVGDVVETVERLRADPFGAVVCVDIDRAAREAAALRSELRRYGPRGPLHGLAVGVKDLIDVAGFPTRAGSAVRAQARPAVRDAPVVARLRDAGAVVVAKLHTHEFGHLPTGDVAAEGPAYNPHDPARIAGGSSSGSAVAVAAGYLGLALGSDTGGSVRIPAALCGVVGVKPPYGLVPGTAMVPVAPSLDTVGLLAAGPREAMAGRAAIAGWTGEGLDPRRSTVGVAVDPYWTSVEPAVTTAVACARRRLERSGVRVVEVTTPQVEELAATYMPIVGAELYAAHARSLAVCGGLYQAETREGLEHLAGTPASEREDALLRARALSAQLARHLSGIDVLLTATTRIRATALGARLVDVADERSTVASALLDLTLPASVTGWPAVSAPVPTPGLPAGAQLIGVGHRVDERLLLSLARTISTTPDGP